MKPYLIIAAGFALVLLAGACHRRLAPTAGRPRALTGTVELRLGDVVQRYAVRVERAPSGFAAALRPLGTAVPPPHQLAAIPFVRDDPAPAPTVIETPHGTVATRFAYRPLGPWQVLDRAVTSIVVRTPRGDRTVDLEVALRAPRLER